MRAMVIAALAILPLSAQAQSFSPPSTHYKLNATFDLTIQGVSHKCFAQLRGVTTATGLLKIDRWTSKCLVVKNLPRTANVTPNDVGYVSMVVTYGPTGCGGSLYFTLSNTGYMVIAPVSDGECILSATGQFTPVITIAP